MCEIREEVLQKFVEGHWKLTDSKHGDTAVLEFDPSKPVEVLLIAIGAGAEGVKESERGLGSELVRQRVLEKGGALLLDRSGGEGGGGADEGKGGDRLHHV